MDALPFDVPIHFASFHEDRQAGYEEFNPGIGIRLPHATRKQLWGAAGLYRNSNGDLSLYGGFQLGLLEFGAMRLQVLGGLVTGYEAGTAIPFIIPEVQFTISPTIAISVGVTPSAEYKEYSIEPTVTFTVVILGG